MAIERPTVRLMGGRDKRLLRGSPWVYSNEIAMDSAVKTLPPGSVVTLARGDGQPLATAMFNPHTLIAARILSRDPGQRIDRAFLVSRLRQALLLRERLYATPFYRLVHAEADGLPGTILDRYGDALVVQINSAGMAGLEQELLAAIEDVLSPAAIILHRDSPAREVEKLSLEPAVAIGSRDGPVELEENGARFRVDVLGGQKTGWFYDQRDNRAFVAALSAGQRVIDFYSYAGGFAVQCALAGAAEVIAVDRSAAALEAGAASAALNEVGGPCSFVRAEAFSEMERLGAAGERFGVVIVDPPAFVKSRKDLQAGLRGYRKMVRLAARLVQPGGFLLAASCSHNVDPPAFLSEVQNGLADARRGGRMLRFAGAAPDHPVHPFLPESAYLKAATLQLD